MIYRRALLPFLGGLSLVSLVVSGCAQQALPPTPTKTPNGLLAAPNNPSLFTTTTPTTAPSETPTDGPPATATFAPTETPLDAPTWTPPPTRTVLPPERNHFWFVRPIPDGYTNFVDRTYPYGGTKGGELEVHHGYEFNNPRGTPIVSPSRGEIAYAGDDNAVQFGPKLFYYGYLVVLKTDAVDPAGGKPIYLLFGHMDAIEVSVGDRVEPGDTLGTVGNSGIAQGAHLHFEVRMGDDMHDYNAVRNADLWLATFSDSGTIVGRVVDGNGSPLYGVAVTMKDVDGQYGPFYTWTYSDDSVRPDDVWQENFTRGDLPEAWYRVYINHPQTGKTIEDYVFVEAGKITWVEFVAE